MPFQQIDWGLCFLVLINLIVLAAGLFLILWEPEKTKIYKCSGCGKLSKQMRYDGEVSDNGKFYFIPSQGNKVFCSGCLEIDKIGG